ncbi:MAG: hypothetical protein RI946_1285, partial [Pseudomonadota bacterium]
SHLPPTVIIGGLTPQVQHTVDGTASAQDFSAGIQKRSAVQSGIGFGFELPVGAGIIDAIQIPHRNMHPVIVIVAACF